MASAEYELGYLEAVIELLQGDLLSKEIYWKITAISPPGEPGYPGLTLGTILLSQKRIEARSLTPAQESRHYQVQNKIEQLRTRWRTAWGGKAREDRCDPRCPETHPCPKAPSQQGQGGSTAK